MSFVLPPPLSLAHLNHLGNTHSSSKPSPWKPWPFHHSTPFRPGTFSLVTPHCPSSVHGPPPISNPSLGCFPSWIHLHLVYTGHCYLSLVLSYPLTGLPPCLLIYSPHSIFVKPRCLSFTFQWLPLSLLMMKSRIFHPGLNCHPCPSPQAFSHSVCPSSFLLQVSQKQAPFSRLSSLLPTLKTTHEWSFSPSSCLKGKRFLRKPHLLSIAICQ